MYLLRHRTLLIWGIAVGIFIAPALVCFFLFGWQDVRLLWSLAIYPGAQEVSSGFAKYGASSMLRTTYYWTPVEIDKVREFYEVFSLPFIDNTTVFHPYGDSLIAYGIDGKPITDFSERFCHYTQKYACVRVQLTDFSPSELVQIPTTSLPLSWKRATETPFSDYLVGGTLISYAFFVSDY